MTPARLAVASLLLAAAPAAAQGVSNEAFDISLPLRVGAYERAALEVVQGAYLTRYRTEDGRYVDAFFYPYAVTAACGAACDSVAVDTEADGFPAGIPVLLAQGYYERLALAHDERVARPAGAREWRGRHLVLRGAREGGEVTSQFYLLSEGTYLMKLRATYAPDTAVDAEVDAFAGGLVRAIGELNAGCPADEYAGPGYVITADVPQPPAEVAERVAAYLTGNGFTVVPISQPNTVITAARWTPAAEMDSTADGRNPGTRVAVVATAKGEGSGVEIGVKVVCRMPDADDAAHTRMELVGATLIQMFVTGKQDP
jgi:hypothetical protein